MKLTHLLDRWFFNGNSRNYKTLFGLVGLLVVLGLAMVLSSSSITSLMNNNDAWAIFSKQLGFVGLGFLGMFMVARLPVSTIFRWTPGIFGLGLFAQLMVVIPGIGVSVNGNQNWLKLGPFQLQPSEFWKLGMILMIAKVVQENIGAIYDFRSFAGRVLTIGAIPIGMIGILSRDMGTALVMALIVFLMLFLTGVPYSLIKKPLLLTAGAAILGLFLAGSRVARVKAWLFPGNDDSTPYDWQSEHGIWALAAGRLSGVGLGNSKLKWSWIPEVDNDYIFAIIGEEWGWIGASLIIILFILIINRIRLISLESTDVFGRMATLGVMIWIAVQTLVNIAVVIKFLPVLGVPLPLISSGGSSLIATLLGIGVVLAIDRESHGIAVNPIRISRSKVAK